jgi:hypothetical protein
MEAPARNWPDVREALTIAREVHGAAWIVEELLNLGPCSRLPPMGLRDGRRNVSQPTALRGRPSHQAGARVRPFDDDGFAPGIILVEGYRVVTGRWIDTVFVQH